jgi:hypothetical protein
MPASLPDRGPHPASRSVQKDIQYRCPADRFGVTSLAGPQLLVALEATAMDRP